MIIFYSDNPLPADGFNRYRINEKHDAITPSLIYSK